VALSVASVAVLFSVPVVPTGRAAPLRLASTAVTTYTVPATIPADGSRAVESDIMQFLTTVPDGSKVLFPPNGIYGQNGPIDVPDRTNLEIDGNGSTFKQLLPTDPSRPNNANWRIAGGNGVVLHSLVIRGAYDPVPRGTIDQGFPNDHGISILGAQNAQVRDVQVFNVAGDFLACDPDVRRGSDYASDPPCRNVLVDGLRGQHAGRQGVSATAADGFTLQNSSLTDVQNEGVDLEIDVAGELMRNVNVVNNEFSGIYGPSVFVPMGTWPDVGNITIQGNHVLSPDDLCWPTIHVEAQTQGVLVRDNHLLSKGDGVQIGRAHV